MECPQCGAKNPEDSRFCGQCSTPLPFPDETLIVDQDALPRPGESFKPNGIFAGRYEILEALGGGGMGQVYKARDKKLNRYVALKFLAPGLGSRKEAKSRFIQEAQAASVLDHQNICTIYEIDETPQGQMYIAMAYYEGETLKKKIQRGVQNFGESLDAVIQIARGLSKAHGRGIIHRDIKPANVIATSDGVMKIVDFGLAILAREARLTQTSALIGTPAYMSPEQAFGESVDQRTDLWSLGVVFYELLTGLLPFPGDSGRAILYAIINRPPIPPRDLGSDIPEEAEWIILKCLRKEPEKRYSSADQLLEDLLKLRASLEKGKEGLVGQKREETQRETERRLATVLSGEILNSAEALKSLGTEEAALVMNRLFNLFSSIIKKYGSRIDRATGSSFMASFGAPQAIEDAPKKAVNAAIELRNSIESFNREEHLKVHLNLRMGIEVGVVIAGAMESGQYSIMGEAVNLASRLKDFSGPGEISVGPQAHRSTQNVFDFTGPKPVSIKGWKDLLPAFQLLSQRENVYRARLGRERMVSSKMVGRAREMDKLKLHLLKVVNGEGSIVNVIGEAGIGKSRLIAELSSENEMDKTLFLMGRALSIGKNLSFHPLIDILKNWAQIKDDDAQATISQKLEKAVNNVDPEGVTEVFPFIATMMGIKLKGKHAERVTGIEGEALEKLILKNLRELLVKAADIRPIVFIVEDLHWSDRTSLELLVSLCRLAENTRILFINIFRPNYPETSGRFLETITIRYPGLHSEIVLEPLNDRECETLIENLLNIKGLPAHIRELIGQKAEGNPFFVEEVARSFIDEGVVEMKDGQFRVTERINNVIIPETINEILMARIDNLEEDTKSLLKIASVIGRNFFYKILVEVAKTVEGIEDKLEFLKEVQLIKERTRLEEREYLFNHALIQEAAYESILLVKRKELHLKVAEAIEYVFPERLHEFFGMLAFHYSSGENLEKAEEYLIKAGQEALNAAASSEAINYYQEALSLYQAKHGDSGDPETIANLEWNIAKAFLNKGHMVEAVAHFDRVLELWGERRPKNRWAASLQFLFSLLKVLRSLYLPTWKIKQIPTKRMNDIFEATYQRGMALVSTDTRRMVRDSIQFLGTIRKYDLGRVGNGVPIYASSSALFFFSGISFRIARKLLDHAKSHIRPEDVKTFLTYKFWELAMDTLWGNWRTELGYNAGAVDGNIQDGDLFAAPGLVFWAGLLVTKQGRFAETQIYINKLQEIGDVYENDYARSRRLALNISYLLESRRLTQILPEADQGISWLNKIGQDFWALYLTGLKAQALLFRGDLRGAEDALALAGGSISDEKIIAPFYISTFLLSRFMLDLQRLENALRSNDKSRIARCQKEACQSGRKAIKNAMKCAPNQTDAFRLEGIFYWLLGNQKRALAWWARSVDVGERLGARPGLARTHGEVGRRLREKNSRFRALKDVTTEENIKRARRLFEEMELAWDMEELGKG